MTVWTVLSPEVCSQHLIARCGVDACNQNKKHEETEKSEIQNHPQLHS